MKRIITAVMLALGATSAIATPSVMHSDSILLLVGSYAPVQAEGIALYSFDQNTGHASRLCGLSGISNPSYQTVRPDYRLIYSVGEDGHQSSTVNAIAYTTTPPSLQLVASVPTGGASPCHVNLSPDGSQLYTANYGGGSATCYRLDNTGLPVGKASVIDFNTTDRAAHAHYVTPTPDGSQLWVTDLGRDRIHTVPMHDGRADWRSEAVSDIQLPAGAGPRHVDFLPRPQRAYVIDELDGHVNVLDYSGRLLQRIAADSVGAHGSGDIHLSPDGRHLYASNRLKADGIAIFVVDQTSGFLTKVGYQLTGPHPRNFIITPNGRYMLVACRDSDAIELYRIDTATGLLEPDGRSIAFDKPVCLCWVE